jgi:hypothetical protein
MYDDDHRIVRWRGRPLRRPADSPTPCWSCPKRNPAYAAGYERDAARIERALQIYFQIRATAGSGTLAGSLLDPLLRRNLTIIDAIVRRWERTRGGAART